LTIVFENDKKTKTAHFIGGTSMKAILKVLIFAAIIFFCMGILDIIEEKLYDASLPLWLYLIFFMGYLYLISRIGEWIEPGVNNLSDAVTTEINCPATRSVRQIVKKRNSHPPSINSTKSLRLASSSSKNHD